MNETKYVIRCKERNRYFVAIHGYSPFFSKVESARKFESREAATRYADGELFTTPDAYEVEEIRPVGRLVSLNPA